jgi:hypothetical protein
METQMGNRRKCANRRWPGRGRAVWGTRHGAHQCSGNGGAAGPLGRSGGGGKAQREHLPMWERRREGGEWCGMLWVGGALL